MFLSKKVAYLSISSVLLTGILVSTGTNVLSANSQNNDQKNANANSNANANGNGNPNANPNANSNTIPKPDPNPNANENAIEFEVNPANSFLKAANMVPGDQVTSEININNNRGYDITCSVANSQVGSISFYNQLMVTVLNDRGTRIYDGKLKDLQNVNLGVISGKTSRTYTFIATLPQQVTNELQNTSTDISFTFNAYK